MQAAPPANDLVTVPTEAPHHAIIAAFEAAPWLFDEGRYKDMETIYAAMVAAAAVTHCGSQQPLPNSRFPGS